MATGPLPANRKITTDQLQLLESADPNNYIQIRINWSVHFILPFDAGVAFITSLQKMEKLDDGLIMPINDEDKPSFNIISKERYIEMKMKFLLEGIPEEEEINV